MANYKRKFRPISIGLSSIVRQDRVNLNPNFHCISWRERRHPSNSNRRFYFEDGAYWSLPIDRALQMMQLAKQAGFFDINSDDPGKIASVIVAEPGNVAYEKIIAKALVNSDFESEWQNSAAIICNQACGQWRKIMIVNFNTRKVTFRSLTSDRTYRFARREESSDGWRLDRSMLDAHPSAFEHWLNYLQAIVANE